MQVSRSWLDGLTRRTIRHWSSKERLGSERAERACKQRAPWQLSCQCVLFMIMHDLWPPRPATDQDQSSTPNPQVCWFDFLNLVQKEKSLLRKRAVFAPTRFSLIRTSTWDLGLGVGWKSDPQQSRKNPKLRQKKLSLSTGCPSERGSEERLLRSCLFLFFPRNFSIQRLLRR